MLRELKMMRAAVALLVALAVFATPAWSATKEAASDVVVTVNGTAITRQDFDREMMTAQQYFAAMGHENIQGDKLEQVKRAVLNKLISSTLLLQASKKGGIKVDRAKVEAEAKGFRGRFSSDKEYQAAISKLHISEAGLREKISEGMAIQAFIQRDFTDKAKVTEKEIKEYYDNNSAAFHKPEQVKASHILISVKPDADAATKKAAREKLERIRKQILAGGDFAAFAKNNSDCPSKTQGGDLGYFSRGQMVKPFEQAAFSMMPGDISDIVETQFGYHIIKVVDKKPATTISFADAHDRIAEHLKQVKAQEDVSAYLKKLRKEAKIVPDTPAE